MVQLVFAVGVQFAVGLVVLFTTVAEQVAVHPFVVLVTVTVYVPPFNPVIVAVVPPLLHKYVTPVAVAVALPFGVEQFVLSTLEQVTVGGVLLTVTKTTSVSVQPFAAVTVTVYVVVITGVTVMLFVDSPVLHR